MIQTYCKQDFANMTFLEIEIWTKLHFQKLIGSAIFTKNKSTVSKIVQWAETWKNKENRFIPSHTGSLVEKSNRIYIFDMKPPKATIQPLSYYLANTEEDYVLVMRDFKLDTKMFSANILEHLGQCYPFMSAIRSVFTKRQSKWATHCSELHIRELQKQNILTDLNPEITPDELLQVLINASRGGR